MKDYMITCDDDCYIVNKRIGEDAYIAVFFGNHNEVVKYFSDNGIKNYGYGF